MGKLALGNSEKSGTDVSIKTMFLSFMLLWLNFQEFLLIANGANISVI